MGKLHLKRLNAPKTWPVERKSTKWITKPNPGSQKLHRTLSIGTIMKEVLKIVNTSKEVKTILNKGLIKVDHTVRKEINFPVSVMDVITIKDDNYRLLINTKGKLFFHPIKKQDAEIKPKKIIGKKILKGNKIQINFLGGDNIISTDEKLKVCDTIVYEKGKQKEHLKFEKGSLIYLLEGKQVGKMGVIKEIQAKKGLEHGRLIFQAGKKDYITKRDYAVVIGKTRPLIDIPNE
jgi:small subunit ribosomal protein S4e